MDYYQSLIQKIKDGEVSDMDQLQNEKKKLALGMGLSKFPTNADILAHAGKDKKQVIHVLQKKPSRTKSGIAAVAVMTPPQDCPHGKCVYCPGGTVIDTPQSYTGEEPAAMRGRQYSYNPFLQTTARIKQLEMIGHNCDKIELIIMGGTFTYRPLKEQQEFIKGCFDGLNGKKASSLERAMAMNEISKSSHILTQDEISRHKCVGLTIETRPDYCGTRQINNMLSYGTTRVEVGVQHPDDDIYFQIGRGHSVESVVDSTQKLKDSALKVNYHLMPNLPGSTYKKDLRMFKEIFTNPNYKPDMLKIYPTMLINPDYGKTELHEMYKDGTWKPYSEKKMVDLLAKAKSEFPKWVRIMRVQRDIPSTLVYKGVKHTNLRQMVQKHMKGAKLKCDCIRCREIGIDEAQSPELMVEKYKASKGTEYFISLEEKNKLVGFIRLRDPYKPFREEIDSHTGLIRELHVYGPVVPINEKSDKKSQHKGFGAQLLFEAEKLAKEEFDAKKMVVMSGVGVREYYRKHDYELEGPYMTKTI